jgi:hypothetical protein
MIESAFGSAPSQRPATRRKPRSTATARFGWSGVEKLVRPRGIRRRLRDVILLLPHRRSTITALTEELLGLGAHYHRNLRQDEFGPTRAQAANRVLRVSRNRASAACVCPPSCALRPRQISGKWGARPVACSGRFVRAYPVFLLGP